MCVRTIFRHWLARRCRHLELRFQRQRQNALPRCMYIPSLSLLCMYPSIHPSYLSIYLISLLPYPRQHQLHCSKLLNVLLQGTYCGMERQLHTQRNRVKNQSIIHVETFVGENLAKNILWWVERKLCTISMPFAQTFVEETFVDGCNGAKFPVGFHPCKFAATVCTCINGVLTLQWISFQATFSVRSLRNLFHL